MDDVKEMAESYWSLSKELKGMEIHSREFITQLRIISHIRQKIDELCIHDYRYSAMNHAVCISCGLDKP